MAEFEQTRFHPGEHLQLELDELGMSAEEMAHRLQVPPDLLREFLRGERSIDADLAMRLGHFFGTSATIWFNFQVGYDLEQMEWQRGSQIRDLPTLRAA